jgi:D-glycero-alpha-D-manno-heptose-7-phosphate kinase
LEKFALIIVQTPLRISFFGGGTDFPSYFLNEGGCVLSSAINKFIFVTVKQRFDDKLRVGYTRTEIVDRIDEINHELIREALRLTGVERGVEVITMGDIPAGSGLGSSSTVTVGALHAMYAYQNMLVPMERLAEEACDIEVNILGKPIGFQDQYIAAFGGLRIIEFNQNGQVNPRMVHLDPVIQNRLSENLLLFFTGVTRKSESILSQQKDNINNRLPVLRTLKEMAYQAREALCAGQLEDFGRLMHESWQLKKQLANGISNKALEESYNAALAAGAIGGKVTGAGGGGFLMLFCPLEKRESVRAALSHLRELPFQLEPDGTKVIFNYRY